MLIPLIACGLVNSNLMCLAVLAGNCLISSSLSAEI